MLAKTRLISGILCVIGAVSCASAAPQTSEAKSAEATARILKSDAVLPDQIENDTTATPISSLIVDQIDQSAINTDYAFSDVEGDDPCLDPEASTTARCQTSQLSGSSLMGGHKRSSETALEELQSIVPNVVDPNSFDAERTADEIGRSGRSLRSQAGMALGAQFLNPVPELEGEGDPESDRPDEISPLSPDFIPPPRAGSQ
jgi:hypothetical protein